MARLAPSGDASPVREDRTDPDRGAPPERDAREREARLELALEVAELGTWSWDLETGRGDIDARGAQIVGLRPGDLGDVTAAQRERVHPDDLAHLDATIAAGIAAGGTFSLLYRVIHPDDTVHHVLSRCRVIADAAGRPVRLVGTNRDVTAERETEVALREREERYRTLFESIDEGFCILEVLFDRDDSPVDYRFLEFNPAFVRHTGLEQAAGRTALELVPDLEPTWVQAMGRVALTGEATRFTDRAAAMGRWFEVSAFRVGHPAERHVAVLVTDVSARVRAEEEREELIDREREAREAAEAFLAVMSHELRTPITSIYGTALLLARHPARADVADLVGDIRDESEQLRRITDDLLVLSGVERGLLRLSPEPTIVQHAINEVLVDIRRRFPLATFERALEPGLPPVIADATALRQVLYNLLSNAAKYAGADGPIVVAATRGETSVEVAVLDEGPGPGGDPAALFRLFYRAPHTKKRASGTGIGLYVASELLKAMGATIEAQHRTPRGAAFRFTLALAREDDDL